ncbi:hypothetical protein ACE02P_18155 [Shewanella bicestrii]|jgi:hypothetical protein
MNNFKYVVDRNAKVETLYNVESEVYLNENGIYCMLHPLWIPENGTELTWDEYQARKSQQGYDLILITQEQCDARLQEYKEWITQQDQREVDEERWFDMLEVLPPCRWQHAHGVEIFHVSERISLNFVSWFGCLYDNGVKRYFEITDEATTPPADIAIRFKKLAAI